MKCAVDGCYGRTQIRGFCRAHYRMWREALMSDDEPRGLVMRKETSDVAQPASPWTPWCSCQHPLTAAVNPFPGAQMCVRCGKPPRESLGVTG